MRLHRRALFGGAAGAASAGLRPLSKVHDPLFVSIESQRFKSRGANGFTFAGGGASRASRPGPPPPSCRPKRLRAGPALPSRGTRIEKPPHSSSSDAAPALASLSTPSVAVEARDDMLKDRFNYVGVPRRPRTPDEQAASQAGRVLLLTRVRLVLDSQQPQPGEQGDLRGRRWRRRARGETTSRPRATARWQPRSTLW